VIGKEAGSVKPDAMQPFRIEVPALVILLLASTSSSNAQTSNSLPTLYLIGDSTVNTPTKGQQGWGTSLPGFFDQSKITVVNRARGGRSSRTFYTEELWEQVRDSLKPGDFVLMQFGHNDGGPLGDGRARASLKGNGEETQEVDNKTTGKKEAVHTYGWYLRKYIGDTKAKGATAIVLSPIPRNIWKDGKVARAANDYGKWAAEAAKAEGVPFVNLNEIIATHYEEAGQPKVAENYFTATDHTHTTPEGAKLNAACVCEGIRSLKDCPLAKYLLPTDKPIEK
jgi:rhamnogalacturonan acetylesterase